MRSDQKPGYMPSSAGSHMMMVGVDKDDDDDDELLVDEGNIVLTVAELKEAIALLLAL